MRGGERRRGRGGGGERGIGGGGWDGEGGEGKGEQGRSAAPDPPQLFKHPVSFPLPSKVPGQHSALARGRPGSCSKQLAEVSSRPEASLQPSWAQVGRPAALGEPPGWGAAGDGVDGRPELRGKHRTEPPPTGYSPQGPLSLSPGSHL